MKKQTRERLSSWLRGELDLTNTLPEAPMPEQTGEPEQPHPMVDWQPKPIKPLEQRELRLFRKVYPFCAAIMGIAIVAVLLVTVFSLPRFGGEEVPANNEVAGRYLADGPTETGAVNLVAGMILDYRAFDTLGESHVLFTGVCAVILLLESTAETSLFGRRKRRSTPPRLDLTKDPILHQAALFLVPVIV